MKIKNTDLGLTVIFISLISVFSLVISSLTLNPPRKTIVKENIIIKQKKDADKVIIVKSKDRIVIKKEKDKVIIKKLDDKIVWKDSDPIIKTETKELHGKVYDAPSRGYKKGIVAICGNRGLKFEDGRGFIPHGNERSESMKLKKMLNTKKEYLALVLKPDGSAKKCSIPFLMNIDRAGIEYAIFPVYD